MMRLGLCRATLAGDFASDGARCAEHRRAARTDDSIAATVKEVWKRLILAIHTLWEACAAISPQKEPLPFSFHRSGGSIGGSANRMDGPRGVAATFSGTMLGQRVPASYSLAYT
jgi:hypothetical protein